MSHDWSEAFSVDYAQARAAFGRAALQAGTRTHAYPHPLPGAQGETLALDVAVDGALMADKWLVISSACHGVEGFCGSGVQIAALRDGALRAQARAAGVTLLYLHALNPYGFSHLRRVTHENVDLNRNFHDFTQPLPLNPAYDDIQDLLLPDTWPPTEANRAALADYVAQHGRAQLQAALSQGQHRHADGLFYGGLGPTWSHRTLRQVVDAYLKPARHMAWVDLHTGLGPCGVGERIHNGPSDPLSLARARAWWSGDGATPVTSVDDGSSVSVKITGTLGQAIGSACSHASFTGIALEYGTLPFEEVMEALRAEHWRHRHPEAPFEQRVAIGQQLKDAFYVDTDTWRHQVVTQGLEAFSQAIAGLQSL